MGEVRREGVAEEHGGLYVMGEVMREELTVEDGGSCVKEEVTVQQGSAACAVRSKELSTVVAAALHTKGTTGVVEN